MNLLVISAFRQSFQFCICCSVLSEGQIGSKMQDKLTTHPWELCQAEASWHDERCLDVEQQVKKSGFKTDPTGCNKMIDLPFGGPKVFCISIKMFVSSILHSTCY